MEVGRTKENGAYYDLAQVKELVSVGRYVMWGRPTSFILNHYGAPASATLEKIIETMEDRDFTSSVELIKIPGTRADEYMVSYDDIDWYVKLFIDSDDGVGVQILSCSWDGVTH